MTEQVDVAYCINGCDRPGVVERPYSVDVVGREIEECVELVCIVCASALQ